jgi:CelD/BcsL family acetyltransferase involved in cellulose biosynthesis
VETKFPPGPDPQDAEEISTAILRTRKEVFALDEEYAELHASLSCPNVYASPEWVFNWLLSLGRRHEVFFVTARRGGRLAGVWPFFEYRLPAFGKGLLPACAQAADIFDPVGHPETLEPMVQALMEAMPEFRFAWLPLVSRPFAEGVLGPCMERWKPPHLLRQRTPRFIVDFAPFPDFSSYLETVFGPKTRQSLRRKARRLEEAGEVRMRILETPGEILEWLPRMAEVERASWKAKTGDGILQRSELRTFYRLLFESLGDRRQMRVGVLTVDGRLVAYEIGFLGMDSYCMHSTVFDEEFGAHSPGRQLMLFSMRTCMEEGRRYYDFLQNDAEFKRQLATLESRMWDWILLPRTVPGRLSKIVLRGVQAWTDFRNRGRRKDGALERERYREMPEEKPENP